MRTYPSFYIDGEWRTPHSADTLPVYSASTEEPIGSIPSGTAQDVDAAVKAARRAFGPWSESSATERAGWLARLADALDAKQQELATVISEEVGTPIKLSPIIQVTSPIQVTRGYAKMIETWPFEETVGQSLVLREPIGVVAAITPWNYPLHQIMAKVAAALAAGCTVVLKPSELAPLNACLLADACIEIGLPRGVLNIIHGEGPVVGEAMASHPGVDMVSLTGSGRAGKRVATLAADTVKKIALELGGKSACLILDDAPLDKAVPNGVKNAMMNSGQTCSAWTRMLVPRDRMTDVLDAVVATLKTLPVGNPLDAATRLGPLISEPQRQRVEGYIAKGKAEGARLVTGGGRPAHLTKGHYVEPTIFADVTASMTIAQEEIFGPVLSVMPYDTEDEGVAIANDTIYGLAGGVWSADPDRALRVARKIRAGQVHVNGGHYNPLAPFGGYKQSGVGREFGTYGLEEFLQVKAVAR